MCVEVCANVCVCVVMAKYGLGDNNCLSFEQFARSGVRFCQCCSVTTVHDAAMKLQVEIKMKAEFEDGCGLRRGARSRRGGSREGTISPPLYTPGPHLY